MERKVPIILGGLAALVGIVYIVYKSSEQAPPQIVNQNELLNTVEGKPSVVKNPGTLEEINPDQDGYGFSGSQPTAESPYTETAFPTDTSKT